MLWFKKKVWVVSKGGGTPQRRSTSFWKFPPERPSRMRRLSFQSIYSQKLIFTWKLTGLLRNPNHFFFSGLSRKRFNAGTISESQRASYTVVCVCFLTHHLLSSFFIWTVWCVCLFNPDGMRKDFSVESVAVKSTTSAEQSIKSNNLNSLECNVH